MNKCRRAGYVVMCVSIAGGLLFSGCVTTDWQTAQQQDTLEGYKVFVEKNPNSKYSYEARNKIKMFTDWQTAQKQDTLEGFRTFLKNNPNSKYNQEARNKIKTFEAAKKAREDEAKAALAKADEEGTEKAFLDVASQYSNTAAGREAAAATKSRISNSELKSNISKNWSTDWKAFVALFQPYFDRGKITGEEKAELAKTMHGALVKWKGRVKLKENGKIVLSMPYASLRFNVVTSSGPYGGTTKTTTSTYIADSLTITPSWKNRKAWTRVKQGDSVSFHAALVGCGLDQVFIGLGPNAGKIFILWETYDAELVDRNN